MPPYGRAYNTTVYDAPTFTGDAHPFSGGGGTEPPETPPVLPPETPPVVPPAPPTQTPNVPGTPPLTVPKETAIRSTVPPFNWQNALDWVQAQYNLNQSTNPGLLTENPPQYWAARIAEDAGAHDEAYWARRMATPTAQWNAQNSGNAVGPEDAWLKSGGLPNLGNLFDDPAALSLMNILQQRIGQLTTPINDPNAALVTSAIQDALSRLGRIQDQPLAPLPPAAPLQDLPDMSAQFDALLRAIEANTASTTGPTAQYRSILDKLISDLGKPAFSDDQLGQLRTAAVDTLNHEHQLALENKTRALGMSGIPPSSGIAQEALKNVDAQYQTLKAQSLQAQNTAEIAMVNERRQQLMQAASSGLTAAQQQAAQEQAALVAQMNLLMNQRAQNIDVRGQNLTAQQLAAQSALTARGQDITLRGQDIAGTATGVTLAQALEELGRNQRAEQNANYNQAVSYAGIPVDLSSQRLSQALQVLGLGGGTSATSLLSALNAIAGTTATGNQTSAANNAALYSTIGNLIAGRH